jgi:hypothetical protein
MAKDLVFDLSPTQSMFVFSDAHVVMLKGPMGEGKTFAAMAGIIQHANRCYQYNPELKLLRGALVRDTHTNIKISTVPDIQQEFGDYVEFKDDYKKMIIHIRPVPVHLDLFGIDDPASLSKLQGPQYAIIWLEEPAPIVEKANAGLPRAVFDLSIARAARQKGTLLRVQISQNPADEDHWTEEVANLPRVLAVDPDTGAEIIKECYEMQPGENKYLNPLARAANRAAFQHDPGKKARYVDGRAAPVSPGKRVATGYNAAIHYPKRELIVVPGALGLRFWDGWHHPACILGQWLPPGRVIIHHACQGDNISVRALITSQVKPLLHTRKYRGKIKEWRDIGDPSMRIPDQSSRQTVTSKVLEGLLDTRFEPGPTLQKYRFDPMNTALTEMLPDGSGPQILLSRTAYNLHRALNGGWHWKVDNSGNVVGTKPVKDAAGDLGDGFSYGISTLFPYVRIPSKPKKNRRPSNRQVRAMAYAHGMTKAGRMNRRGITLSRGF